MRGYVLLVDPDGPAAMVRRQLLELDGYYVARTHGPQDALQLLDFIVFDSVVVVVDDVTEELKGLLRAVKKLRYRSILLLDRRQWVGVTVEALSHARIPSDDHVGLLTAVGA